MLKLIDDWNKWHRLWSIRLQAIGAAILSAFLAFPETMLGIWNNAMPAEVKDILPGNLVMIVPLGFFIAAMIARVVKQEKLKDGDEQGS